MIDDKRMEEIRERAARKVRVMPADWELHRDGQDALDLLSSLEELEADNAALCGMLSRVLDGYPDDSPMAIEGYAMIWKKPSPGTALLARHAEELKTKDTQIALAIKMEELQRGQFAILQSSLARVKKALRDLAVSPAADVGDIAEPVLGMCATCDKTWEPGEPESHNPIDGQPCPAEEG